MSNNTNAVAKIENNGSEVIFHLVECYGEIHWTAQEALSISSGIGFDAWSWTALDKMFQSYLAAGHKARFQIKAL